MGVGGVEIWRYGDMEIWRYGDGDMEIVRDPGHCPGARQLSGRPAAVLSFISI